MISLLTELRILGTAYSTTIPALTGLEIRVNPCNSCQKTPRVRKFRRRARIPFWPNPKARGGKPAFSCVPSS